MSTKRKTASVNVAVVGLGYMGVTHLRAYQKIRNARIVAVCDAIRLPENGVLRGVAGNIKSNDGDLNLGPKLKTYRELDALLADPGVDVVDICTPTPMHPAQVIAALKAGRHVLCEKPLARASADVKKILAVAAKAKGFLMPAMCMRFWTGWGDLKAVVQGGKYGRVLAAAFRRVSQMPAWSATNAYAGAAMGGALYDLHIHDVDFINYIFGKPKSVSAGGVISKNGSIDHVVARYDYPGGPLVSAEGSWLHQGGFSMGFVINFERATIEYDFAKGGVWLLSEAGKKPREVPWRGPDGYDGEIRYFIDCVARDVRPETVTARDVLVTMQICEAEEKSVRNGAKVNLPA
jgi:predicted dehydrogenase